MKLGFFESFENFKNRNSEHSINSSECIDKASLRTPGIVIVPVPFGFQSFPDIFVSQA
jgi:hypothetical protein